jgi:hypothetical protein
MQAVDRQRAGREQHGGGIVPIFALLGEGTLHAEAVEVLIALLEAAGLPEVPSPRLARAFRIASPCPEPERPGLLRQLLATLTHDTARLPLATGVRSIGVRSRRRLYSAGEYDVLIQEDADIAELTGASRGIVGQVLRHGEPVAHASVALDGPRWRPEVIADQEGSFYIPAVLHGSYGLLIWAGNDLIVCTPVAIGESPTGSQPA